ncbi:uncharacterized protein LOC124315560 [Daphnia pulicaria]|uniref:uncharacterized protein LOC124315560 n=1 Tax=Daphnia pulicaria TaxID=35523 RepID=UPI001EEB2C3E|nr:uncharacterized protein LOC124315560 [Daphnia pulicaria]
MKLLVVLICVVTTATPASITTIQTKLAEPDITSSRSSAGVARAVWSNCRGKRLDTLTLNKYVTPQECIEMGGDCCGINADGIMNGSDDPKTMSTTSGNCYTCHSSTTKMKCTGNLVRSQHGFTEDWWINSKNCVKAGGLCCDGVKTLANPAVFDPNEYLDADFCLNCYSGSAQNRTEMEGIWETVVTSCSGQLLANNNYRASDCVFFGGQCCDDDTSTDPNMGGSAFRASTFPDAKCNSCFDGEATEL